MPRPVLAMSAVRSCPGGGRRAVQLPGETQVRARVARLLWQAFPGCRSENALCEVASVALECSPESVRNWLRQTHSARASVFVRLLIIAGAEIVLQEDAP